MNFEATNAAALPYLPGDLEKRQLLSSVPPELMSYTTMLTSFAEFQRTGFEVFTMLNAASLKHTGKAIYNHESILDFGCGAGRIMQFFPPDKGSMYGCDVKSALVNFSSTQFDHASIYRNKNSPPLLFGPGSFEAIYSFSVFSHLREEDERLWLQELARVAQTGCLLFLTIHGDWFIEAGLGEEDRQKAISDGFYWKAVHSRNGNEMDFPEGYEASFHTSDYIRKGSAPPSGVTQEVL